MAALVATRSSEESVLLYDALSSDAGSGGSSSGGGGGGGSGSGGGGVPTTRGRNRKGKHGPKKQPQRGLGVAQLEKLRLQEQSKQEAACLASLGVLMPGYGVPPDQLCGLPAATHHLVAAAAAAAARPAASSSSRSPAAAAALLVPAWANKEHCPADATVLLCRQQQQQQQHQYQQQQQQQQHQYQQQQSSKPLWRPKSYDALAAAHHHPPRGPPINLFDSSHPPGSIQLKRELSLLGVPTVPAELSSFQTKHPAGNGNGNGPGPVWSNASVGSQQKLQHSSSPRFVMVSQAAETHPPASSSNKPTSTTTDSSLKAAAAAAAHYTPRSISTALGSSKPSLPFLNTTSSSRGEEELVKPRKSMLDLDSKMPCCMADPDSLSVARSKKRGPCTSSYVVESLAPTAKRSSSNSNNNSSGGGGDFLALSLSITSSTNNECTSLSSSDSHPLPKPLSMEETGTELEECNARSPSYGSSTTVDLPANKCTKIDLSLKL